MKTRKRKILRSLAGVMFGVMTFIAVTETEVMAADLTAFMSLNAGEAEILDTMEFKTVEELAELPTLDKEEIKETEEVVETTETEEETEEEVEEEVKEEETQEYNIVMARVNESMNIRELPDSSSKKVGLLYADCGGTILEKGDGWTKIQSGNLIGWAKNDYLVFGEAAQKLAQEVGIYEATVHASGLRMRKEPNTESGVWKTVNDGEVFQAITEHTTEEWISVEYGGALGYISADYVSMEFTVDHGETLEEIKERELRERRERQKLIVSEGASYIGTTDEMLLAALIQCEAANQPYEGQVGVGAVVMNRVNSGAYPNTIAGVIYASGQFTPTKSGKVEQLAVDGVKDSCLQAARAAMAGETTVGGALHFRRVGNREGIVIGDHVFW